jgi:hypothetical protein
VRTVSVVVVAAALAAAAVATLTATSGVTPAAAGSGPQTATRVPVPSGTEVPVADGAPVALPPGAVVGAPLAPADRLTVDIVLRPRDPAGLAELASAISSPGTPDSGQYLRRGAAARRFGGDPTTVAALRTLVDEAGLTAGPLGGNALLLSVSGPAGRMEHFFRTGLVRVRLADGSLGRRAVAPVELPASVAGAVDGVVGLDDLVRRQPASTASSTGRLSGRSGAARSRPSGGTPSGPTRPRACTAAVTDASGASGLTDDAIAKAYGADPLYRAGADGAGQTIAVYELDTFTRSDVTAFDTCYFGAATAAAMASRLSVTAVDGGQQAGAGVGEADLDIEDVSALAPGARLHVYEAPNTTAGSLDAFSRVISDDTASVITTSTGLCEAAMQAAEPGVQQMENTLFEEAAAQGQTVVAAAGDTGSSDCDLGSQKVRPLLAVDDPASQPYVLGVGGTSLHVDPSSPETVWNADGFGGGGGLSDTWSAPGWQSTASGFADPTVIGRAGQTAPGAFCGTDLSVCREVPDVSAAADPDAGGVTIVHGGQWETDGGTSSAAPLWAALLTDTASSVSCRTTASGGRGLGFIPPMLYEVAHDPSTDASSFHDVVSGTNAVAPAADGLFPATVGYDMASGLGTPRLSGPGGTPGLADALCAVAGNDPVPTVTGLSPRAVPAVPPAGRPTPTVTVTGSGFENASGLPVVASVTIGDARLPAGTGARSRVDVLSDRSLVVEVPEGARMTAHGMPGDGTGQYQVVVTLDDGATSRPGHASLLHLVGTGAPTLRAVGPTGGPRAGGGTVIVFGTDLGSATGVSFGSVPARIVRAVSDTELTVTVPPLSPATRCATGTSPQTDVCQVEVVVTSAGGASTAVPILPPYQGTYSPDAYGAFPAPAGCGCETIPGPTEYDYLPPPRITSVTADTGADGRAYLSAERPTTVVVHGSGFDILGYQWADVGAWADASSADPALLSISPTSLSFSAPPAPNGSPTPLSVPVTIQTLASPNRLRLRSADPPSNALPVVYAPTPTVSAVHTATVPAAGPRSGGTPLTITGRHLGAATSVLIVDQTPGGPSLAHTSSFTVHGSTLEMVTPPAVVGVDDVTVCSATACSLPDPQVDTFTYYAPDPARLTTDDPEKGPTAGGTVVTLDGAHLGFVVGVLFGSVPAGTFSNPPGANDGGDPSVIHVTAPPGVAGTTVAIRVETLAGLAEGTGYTPVEAGVQFSYAGGTGAVARVRAAPRLPAD